MNKKDVFEEKIAHSHLADYIPEYNGRSWTIFKVIFQLKYILHRTSAGRQGGTGIHIEDVPRLKPQINQSKTNDISTLHMRHR